MTIIILLIIIGQIFASLIPFHLAASASELFGDLKYCNVMPFGTRPLGLAWGAFIREGVMPGFSWLDFFENVLLYLMYGYLVIYAFMRYWRREGWFRLTLLFGFYFPVLEIIKVFIESQHCDINKTCSCS